MGSLYSSALLVSSFAISIFASYESRTLNRVRKRPSSSVFGLSTCGSTVTRGRRTCSRLPGIVPYFQGHIESRLFRLGGFDACACALKLGAGLFQMSSSTAGGFVVKLSLRVTVRDCDASKFVRDSKPNGMIPAKSKHRRSHC